MSLDHVRRLYAITPGEHNALRGVAELQDGTDKFVGQPRRVQYRTLENLHYRGFVAHEFTQEGHDRWQMSERGKRALKALEEATA